MRIPALLLTALLTMPLPLQAGSSGCGPTPSLESSARDAAAVFVGRAGTVSPTSDSVLFDVSWQWKGTEVPASVEVQVAAADTLNSSAASRTFTSGGTYLVFTENAFPPFIVDSCSGSVPYRDGSVIPPSLWEPLGQSQPQAPVEVATETNGANPPSFNALAAAALVGVTLLIVGRVLWTAAQRRKERKAAGPRPFKMRRSDKAWLAEQVKLESSKPSFGERELQKQRAFWRKRRERRLKSLERAAKAAEK